MPNLRVTEVVTYMQLAPGTALPSLYKHLYLQAEIYKHLWKLIARGS